MIQQGNDDEEAEISIDSHQYISMGHGNLVNPGAWCRGTAILEVYIMDSLLNIFKCSWAL